MERYSEYKDSGEQWLGEIPRHWEVKRWHVLMNENTEQNINCSVTKQLQFKYGSIIEKDNQDEDKDVLETISKYLVVKPGDIMLNGLNLNYDFVSQRVGQVTQNGVITSAYICLRSTGRAKEKYLLYLLKAMDSQKLFHGMGTGVRLTLSYKELKNVNLVLPSLPEQSAIVTYLDRVTSQLDEAIAQQQRMIDLLNERKQIIIQHAVTKGLDPKAEMVDSGVEWIGKMPKGWKLIKIKYLAKLQSGSNLTSLEISDSGEVPVYGGNGLRGYYNRYNCDGTYVLIGRQGALCGNINYGKGKFWATEHAVVCHPKMNYKTLWFGEVLRVMNLGQYSQASAQPGLAVEKINNLVLPCPLLEEQDVISSYLEKEISVFNDGIQKCINRITLLRERKQIIINEVVTGKVKVS